jgi:HK97 family phage major capsid protein
MNKLKQIREAMAAKQASLVKVFEEAGSDLDMDKVKSLSGSSIEKVESIRKMNKELEDMGREADALEATEQIAAGTKSREEAAAKAARHAHPEAGVPEKKEGPQMSFGEAFVKSRAYEGRKSNVDAILPEGINLKTLFQTSAGWAAETLRTGRVVEFATRPLQVIDLIPVGQTNQAAIVYMEETTFTNNAAETAEAGAYPESALALTEKSALVKKIAVFIPVTDEQLEDVAQVSGYLDNRLRFMLMQRLDSQILNGDGTGANLTGILNAAGVQTQALGADPVPDAIHKAMTKVRVTGRAMPSGIMLHPNDWEGIRLLRTADGIYIWGNPSEAGPERIWGLPVAQTDALPEGTGLVGDFRQFIELAERRGIQVKVSDSHSDFFVNGKQAVRADVRVALPIYRPSAFCKVTGI